MRSFEIRLRTLFHWWVPRWDPHADLQPEVGGLGERVKVVMEVRNNNKKLVESMK